LLALWLVTALTATAGVIDYYRRIRRPRAAAETAPKVAILVPVKGAARSLTDFLEAIARQDYPAFRVVFAVEAADDPALAVLRAFPRDGRDTETVVAGPAEGRGQKVHNLLAALSRLRPDDALVVFADSDIEPTPHWLRQLVRPVLRGVAGASSGYRWQIPGDGALPTRALAAADWSIATSGRSTRWNLCWGGSTALERGLLDRLDLPRWWRHSASDDLSLTAALRHSRERIYAPLELLVPSTARQDWRGLLAFGRRQYLMCRTYATGHWLLAGWTLAVPAFGAVAGVAGAAAGDSLALAALAAVVSLAELRHAVRRAIVRLILGPDEIARIRPGERLACWAFPIVHLVHLSCFLGSLYGRRFRWAGIEYRFRGRRVEVLSRDAGALPRAADVERCRY